MLFFLLLSEAFYKRKGLQKSNSVNKQFFYSTKMKGYTEKREMIYKEQAT